MTDTREGHWKSQGGGGFKRQIKFLKIMNLINFGIAGKVGGGGNVKTKKLSKGGV